GRNSPARAPPCREADGQSLRNPTANVISMIRATNPALTAKFDFPTPTKPTTFYMVASTPRSGSTYLCYQLWGTGQLGAPQEYFNYNSLMLEMAVRLGTTNIHDYVRRLFEIRTSANGVFAFKAHWSHFQLLRLGDVDMLGYFPRI